MIGERDRRYLRYIVQSIALIERRSSVLWRLQTLAEATARLSEEVKERHPAIPWRAIWGFRNIAAHAYLDINLDEGWEIASLHLAALSVVARAELGD